MIQARQERHTHTNKHRQTNRGHGRHRRRAGTQKDTTEIGLWLKTQEEAHRGSEGLIEGLPYLVDKLGTPVRDDVCQDLPLSFRRLRGVWGWPQSAHL